MDETPSFRYNVELECVWYRLRYCSIDGRTTYSGTKPREFLFTSRYDLGRSSRAFLARVFLSLGV